jgi:hypothetical protein
MVNSGILNGLKESISPRPVSNGVTLTDLSVVAGMSFSILVLKV